jgi:hypothetical protein
MISLAPAVMAEAMQVATRISTSATGRRPRTPHVIISDVIYELWLEDMCLSSAAADAAALSCASPLSLVQLTMDRSIALNLIAASLLHQPTATRSAINQSTSSPSQTSHHGRPFGRGKRDRSNRHVR